ncbi:mRNA interferase HigB [Flavobacterium arsenatis]|uniref:mRNA interferase HigB n=1 Tax=Flavobacterium arsenatis TaxID=1484332 RepID=A0ABU1TLT3_9FLAO|nr:type II toxin-antitoxin system HigB family toxin [Flavobacterium arsenatis]MDR6966930.1 mRNA interferase HigB [Flavobacterium arsenatis]
MRIVTFKRIQEFSENHSDAQTALTIWYHTTISKNWSNLADIKLTFNSVDYVGNNRYVFNIKGNKYRLIAIISFNAQKVYIRFIGTHSEYDKIIDIKNI